jgi:hypothetical protein
MALNFSELYNLFNAQNASAKYFLNEKAAFKKRQAYIKMEEKNIYKCCILINEEKYYAR